jgi:hypothetical protein
MKRTTLLPLTRAHREYGYKEAAKIIAYFKKRRIPLLETTLRNYLGLNLEWEENSRILQILLSPTEIPVEQMNSQLVKSCRNGLFEAVRLIVEHKEIDLHD